MRKIFLDCGAHCGCSTREFLKTHSDAKEFEIFSFEANTKLCELWPRDPELNVIWPVKNHHLINKAVWIYDGSVNFDIMELTGGSTLVPEKIRHNRKNYNCYTNYIDPDVDLHTQKKYHFTKITIPCIDLSQWIQTHFTAEDYIILKMDIEGAEYKILDKMFKDKTLNFIDEICGEWHNFRAGYGKAKEGVLDENYGIKIWPIDKKYMSRLTNQYKLSWKPWRAKCQKKQ